MRWVRVADLSLALQRDGAVLLRAPGRGLGARVPPPVVELLAWCSVSRTEDEVAARFGRGGVEILGRLREAGWIVPEGEDEHTPLFFENFSALDVHRRMLADTPRLDAYAEALRAVVKPDMVVLDAGTGTGVLACLAARAGARKVYAVDNGDVLATAAEVVRASGLEGVVELIRGDFARVTLPEKVDIVVTETFGAFSLAENGLPDVARCAERHLRPGGLLLPARVDLWLGGVHDAGPLDTAVGPFRRYEGVALDVLRGAAGHRAVTMRLTEAQVGARARLASCPLGGAGVAHGSIVLPPGRYTGLCGWFDLHFPHGGVLSTAPGAPPTHWEQQFFPLPLEVDAPLHLDLEAGPAEDDRRGLELRGAWRSGERTGAAWWRLR